MSRSAVRVRSSALIFLFDDSLAEERGATPDPGPVSFGSSQDLSDSGIAPKLEVYRRRVEVHYMRGISLWSS
jgi:hypothetical protein